MRALGRRGGFAFFLAITAAVGFAAAWAVVDWLAIHGAYGSTDQALGGVVLYRHYGDLILSGGVPYRDFALEYPPLSLIAFSIPSMLAGPGGNAIAYIAAFQALTLAFGVVMTFGVVMSASSLGARRQDLVIAAGFTALSPLLIGPVMVSRFDLWPAMLTAVAVAALLRDRSRLAFVVLGLAVLAKVYPAVLLPVFALYVARRQGRGEAIRGLLLLAAVIAVGVLPFLLLAPAGTITALTNFAVRPLQIESLGAAALVVANGVAGIDIAQASSFGSANLVGPLPDVISLAQNLALGGALALTWIGFARGPREPHDLAIGVAATLCLYVALGKVLSPQYVIWLIAPMAILSGTRGRMAIVALAGTLVATGIEWPILYDGYIRFEIGPAMIALIRDLGLCLLATLLAAGVLTRAPHPRLSLQWRAQGRDLGSPEQRPALP
jgi:hypothetical protein